MGYLSIVKIVENAGVVGAGGAGFPTHVKIDTKAEFVIANCAECEPLLHVDKTAIAREPDKLIDGLKAVIENVDAKKGYIAIKAKNESVVKLLQDKLKNQPKIELFLLNNFYPAGDEHVLVNLVTGKIIPEGGIPIHIGVVVCNASTLINISNSINDIPVTKRLVTVTGEVKNPCVGEFPVGTTIKEAINISGGTTIDDYRVIVGGPMMGKIVDDIGTPIDKTTSGIIVLPSAHKLIKNKTQDIQVLLNKAKSVCCQCNYCTQLCPRNLLGHSIFPHKMISTISYNTTDNFDIVSSAYLCSECGLCGLYNCIHEIQPSIVNKYLKEELRKKKILFKGKQKELKENSNSEYRRIPTQRLISRLGIKKYDKKVECNFNITVKYVKIPLKQHIGSPSIPIVKAGDNVSCGQLIASIPEGNMGSNIHSSISGTVKKINDKYIEIEQ